MITLKCTRKLLSLVGGVTTEEPPPPTSALGDWYANVVPTVAGELIIFANEETLLSVALPIGMLDRLVPLFVARVYNLLMTIGVPEAVAARECAKMREVEFAKTSSRSVLGSLNQIAYYYQVVAARDPRRGPPSLSEAERQLSEYLHGPLDYVHPAEVAREQLARHYGYAD